MYQYHKLDEVTVSVRGIDIIKCLCILSDFSIIILRQAAKTELLVAVKGREMPTIPSIYAQMLFMVGPKCNDAISSEELGRAPKHTGGVDALQRASKCQI